MPLFAASTIATRLNMFLEQELIKPDSLLINGLTCGPFGGSVHDLVVKHESEKQNQKSWRSPPTGFNPVPWVFYPNSRWSESIEIPIVKVKTSIYLHKLRTKEAILRNRSVSLVKSQYLLVKDP